MMNTRVNKSPSTRKRYGRKRYNMESIEFYDRLPVMKIALGSIMHESNSFNAEPITLADFRWREATLSDWATGNSEVAGFVEEGQRRGFHLVPTIYAAAAPKGPVASAAFEELTARLVHA